MPDLRDQRGTLLAITGIPVVTVIVVQSLSLIGSPFAKGSAGAAHLLACVFAYLHFVLWAVLVNVLPAPRSKNTPQGIRLPPSSGWFVLGLFFTLFYIVVLGPVIGSP
jgi:hypothetical protein